MPLIIDAHQHLACNMLTYGRDYTRSVMVTRRLDARSTDVARHGASTIGWPEYQRSQVAVIFSTLFAHTTKSKEAPDTVWYKDPNTAHRLYRNQIDLYRKLADSHPGKFRLISSTPQLDSVIEHWSTPEQNG